MYNSVYPQNSHSNQLVMMTTSSSLGDEDELMNLQDPSSSSWMMMSTSHENNNGSTTSADNNEAKSKKKGDKKPKKPLHAFETRSQIDILDDGYRWRKYGQKAVKNYSFPRCTHQNCKVKKQVQRLSRDEGIVVTTYEGIHSHPIDKPNDNFEHILSQMQIYTSI